MYVIILSILLGCICYFYGWYRTKRSINKKNNLLLTSRLKAIDANIYEIAKLFNVKLNR